MEYELKATRIFLLQLDDLSLKSKRILEEKLLLAKENPFRFKRVLIKGLFLFRIRFSDRNREKRAIYLVDKPHIRLLCILDRANEYRDLKKYLKTS